MKLNASVCKTQRKHFVELSRTVRHMFIVWPVTSCSVALCLFTVCPPLTKMNLRRNFRIEINNFSEPINLHLGRLSLNRRHIVPAISQKRITFWTMKFLENSFSLTWAIYVGVHADSAWDCLPARELIKVHSHAPAQMPSNVYLTIMQLQKNSPSNPFFSSSSISKKKCNFRKKIFRSWFLSAMIWWCVYCAP